MKRVSTILLLSICILLLAGCNQVAIEEDRKTATSVELPSNQSEETTITPTTETESENTVQTPDASDVVRVFGNLPVDSELVYARVKRMLGSELRPSTQIFVENRTTVDSNVYPETEGFTAFMGIRPSDDLVRGDGLVTYAVTRGQAITLYRGNATPDTLELYLAHELVHVFQVAGDVNSNLSELPGEFNRRFVYSAVVEGSAEYVQQSYARRYQNRSIQDTETAWRESDPYLRYVLSGYYHGTRYVDSRVEDASQIHRIYRRPPQSTEQILHGYEPDRELPMALQVDSVTNRSSWFVSNSSVKGELFTRIALSTELDYNRSARAAEGWGADRLLTFEKRNGTVRGYAWVLRWDSGGDEAEFMRAIRDFDEQRKDTTFRVAQPAEGTTVVLAGPSCFTSNANAEGGAESVTVSPNGCDRSA